MNVSAANSPSANGSASARPSTSSDRQAACPLARDGEHLRALVERRRRSSRSGGRARARRALCPSRRRARCRRRDVEPRDEEAPPARDPGRTTAARCSGRTSGRAARTACALRRAATGRVYARARGSAEISRVAAEAAAAFAEEGERVDAVLAAEPLARAAASTSARTWAADGRELAALDARGECR